jgi:hypothetical protein
MLMKCDVTKIPTSNESDAEWMKGCERTIQEGYSDISAKRNNGQLDPDQRVRIAGKEGEQRTPPSGKEGKTRDVTK